MIIINDGQHQENSKDTTIANMSDLDFLTLLWEARIVESDYVYEKTGS